MEEGPVFFGGGVSPPGRKAFRPAELWGKLPCYHTSLAGFLREGLKGRVCLIAPLPLCHAFQGAIPDGTQRLAISPPHLL